MTAESAATLPLPVLVVDDDTVSRLVLAHMLRQLGFEVVQADDLEPAIELLVSEQFSMVFSDFSMPGGNGLELLARLPPIPDRPMFVLVTGIVDRARREQPGSAEVDAYLSKPVSTRALRACLSAVMAQPGPPT